MHRPTPMAGKAGRDGVPVENDHAQKMSKVDG
jgi:hypothetical protein